MRSPEDENEGEILRLLESLDRDPPALTADAVAALARGSGRRSARPRWAAIILLAVLTGGVAYALPGSPLRSWIQGLLSPPAAPTASSQSPESSQAGVSLDPGDRIAIVFEQTSPGSLAQISLTDETQLVVETRAGDARFTAAPDHILVLVNRDSATVRIRIPRSAPRVEIYLEARRIFDRIGSRVATPLSPGADSSYILRLDS
jgi:hypothetical protein